MSRLDDTIWCAGCGTEIRWGPYVVDEQNFCCQDCALGIKCKCSREMEREDDYRDTNTPVESVYPGN